MRSMRWGHNAGPALILYDYTAFAAALSIESSGRNEQSGQGAAGAEVLFWSAAFSAALAGGSSTKAAENAALQKEQTL
jgi:hypothetical protein